MRNTIKYAIGACCTIPFLPIMYIHGKRIRVKVPDLPEAKGPKGITNKEQMANFQLLLIGESTMAGVGVSTHEEGFGGTLAKVLAAKINKNIAWSVYAKSGINAARVPMELIANITEPKIDLIVIGLGANDAFEGNSPFTWRKGIEQIIKELRNKYPATPIAFTNLPPIKLFPAFTPLIQNTIGRLVELLGEELAETVAEYPNVFFNNIDLTFEGEGAEQYTMDDFFSDGVHPSKLTYQYWANDFANYLVSSKIV